MASGQIHLNPKGPSPCSADHGQCPYETDGHYEDLPSAEAAFAKSMGGSLPESVSKPVEPAGKVKLMLDFDSVEVPEGDLSDPRTRFYFANGLCGDLANAVHSLRGRGKIYFSLGTDRDGRPNSDDLNGMGSIDELSSFVFHAVVESEHSPGKFLDAYGVKSREEIESFFGGPLVEVPSHVLEGFHTGESHDLNSFASTVLQMDKDGISYSYEEYGDSGQIAA